MRVKSVVFSLSHPCDFCCRFFYGNFSLPQNSADCNDENVLTPVVFEISSNASKFAAFAAIRSFVHEHETKYKTLHKLDSKLKSIELKNDENVNESRNIDNSQFSVNKFLIPNVSTINFHLHKIN